MNRDNGKFIWKKDNQNNVKVDLIVRKKTVDRQKDVKFCKIRNDTIKLFFNDWTAKYKYICTSPKL